MSGVSSKCLGKGSPPPGPVPEGQIRIYSMRFCPCSQSVLMVLEAKGIRHEIINIDLKNKPEWYFKKNPSGLVPVLEDSQGRLISGCAIICEYLDEAYPEKKLFPDDPYKKASQKMNLELFSKVPPLVTSSIRVKREKNYLNLQEELDKELGMLEEALTGFNSDFFGGNTVSMSDYLMLPWFQRMEALGLNASTANTPKLKHWMAAMQKDPTVSSHSIDPKVLSRYLQDSQEA